MNTSEAISILKKRCGSWMSSIEPIENGKYLVRYSRRQPPYNSEILTSRAIIKLARIWTSDNNQNTSMKKNVKNFDKSKNRSATRDAIQIGDFDAIPQNGKVKSEDIWSWD
jgi:hypothetical protein